MDRASITADAVLIDRCLRGEGAAWDELFARFHRGLLAAIGAFLGPAGRDVHFVNEIAGRVWASLVLNPSTNLARFDPQRGCRFSTFLSVLAKTQARMLIRADRRRKARQEVAARSERQSAEVDPRRLLRDEELLATLSDAERGFLRDALMAGDESSYSRANAWQLRHRVRSKVKAFFAA